MSKLNKMNWTMADHGFHLSGKRAKFIDLRNEHSVKNRADNLIDRKIKNDSLLQKIRVKFGMWSA